MNTYLSFILVGAAKSSSKSSTRFSLGEVEGIMSPQSFKKELATGPSQTEVKSMTTRAKSETKRKKTSEPSCDAPHIEQLIHDFISEVRITNSQFWNSF
ncbi:hypothetical protein Hanom_Chr01g00054451 [Helianthus anomalus]